MTTSIILSFQKRKIFEYRFYNRQILINLHNTITKTDFWENPICQHRGSGFQDLMFRVNKEQNLALLPTQNHILF